jgi:hypothetical protein
VFRVHNREPVAQAEEGKHEGHSGGSKATGEDEYWRAVAGAMPSDGGATRKYYLQAEEVVWDYAPEGMNMITGMNFTEDEQVFTDMYMGSTYIKCLYFECASSKSCAPCFQQELCCLDAHGSGARELADAPHHVRVHVCMSCMLGLRKPTRAPLAHGCHAC